MSKRNPNHDDAKQHDPIIQALSIGLNKYGQQVNGSTEDVKELQPILNIKQKGIETIQSPLGSLFIKHEDGDVSVGGYNTYGQLGIGSNDEAIKRLVSLGFKVKFISHGIGAYHVFVSTEEGDNEERLLVAGWNKHGQLGVKTSSDKQNAFITGPKIPIDVKEIATGYYHTIFLGCHGIMYVCGEGPNGQLGLTKKTKEVSIPTMIPTKVKMKQVVTGSQHCVALTQEGCCFSWGDNPEGQLGHGDTTNRYTPTQIHALKAVEMASVSCGANHTIFLSSCGTVMVTGKNDDGQCGNGTTTNVLTPTCIVVNDKEIVNIVRCGSHHTVAITVQGNIYFCGWNKYGQCLVDPSKGKVLIPTQYIMHKKWNAKHMEVQVFPGYYETKIVTFDAKKEQSDAKKNAQDASKQAQAKAAKQQAELQAKLRLEQETKQKKQREEAQRLVAEEERI
eukprot:958656_1